MKSDASSPLLKCTAVDANYDPLVHSPKIRRNVRAINPYIRTRVGPDTSQYYNRRSPTQILSLVSEDGERRESLPVGETWYLEVLLCRLVSMLLSTWFLRKPVTLMSVGIAS